MCVASATFIFFQTRKKRWKFLQSVSQICASLTWFGLVLGSSQFMILPLLLLKILITSKVTQQIGVSLCWSDSEIHSVISLYWSKYVIHSVRCGKVSKYRFDLPKMMLKLNNITHRAKLIPTIYDKKWYYTFHRVYHGFRLMRGDDYFWSHFWPLLNQALFLEAAGAVV